MTQIIKLFLGTLRKSSFSKKQLVLENLALQHQLLAYKRSYKKPKMKNTDSREVGFARKKHL